MNKDELAKFLEELNDDVDSTPSEKKSNYFIKNKIINESPTKQPNSFNYSNYKESSEVDSSYYLNNYSNANSFNYPNLNENNINRELVKRTNPTINETTSKNNISNNFQETKTDDWDKDEYDWGTSNNLNRVNNDTNFKSYNDNVILDNKFISSYNNASATDNQYGKKFKKCISLGTAKDNCSDMICSKCDIQVKIFINKKWSNTVDYLFFRSFYDDIEMLKTKCESCVGSSAYSCQCYWISTDKESEKIDNIRWFCNGH